jgi:hypothetical protein
MSTAILLEGQLPAALCQPRPDLARAFTVAAVLLSRPGRGKCRRRRAALRCCQGRVQPGFRLLRQKEDRMAVTKAAYRKLALSFPEAHEKLSYGAPAFFIAKRFFTRLREEDKSIVLFVDTIDERDMLLEADPKTFFITDHYKNYAYILARIDRIDAKTLRGMLERQWRRIAPKKLVKQVDAERGLKPA